MCGIVGVIDSSDQVSNLTLRNMINTLKYRGPDKQDFFTKSFSSCSVGLGHSRLSILDLSENGNQPKKSFCGKYTIVHNGEIYNFKEIREKLIKRKYTFYSNSDTEVILNAFSEWGVDCVNQFIGMFAFAILDQVDRKLYIFRDRAGVKPLYYFYYEGIFLFASELKAFFQLYTS